MSLWIDVKYVNLISSRLSQFKKRSEDVWNFRCPICGDSDKKKSKARGYIYRKGSELFYRCHNCTFGTTLSKFIERIDPTIYKEYVKERFFSKDKNTTWEAPAFSPPVFHNKKQINLESINDLVDGHWAKDYVKNRRIPERHWKDLYFAQDYKAFVQEIGSNKFKDLPEEDPRLVIPFYDEKGDLFGLQGRSLSGSKIRYVTIKLNPDAPLIFGLDRVNKESKVYITEGPLDSMFLSNALAAAGSDLSRVLNIISDPVFVFDNEPRNKDICRSMARVMSLGKKLVIWPDSLREKDINDMVLAGLDPREIISKNTYEGLEAGARLAFWRKA